MLKQQWCACGAGVVDHDPATATRNIAEFIDFHPRICKAGLVEDEPMRVSLRCPHCTYSAYGETQAEAIEQRNQHVESNHSRPE